MNPGVGKEEFFKLIHQHSGRATRPPVAVNCAAIPENMLEAMLFGYEKGAFTGAHKSCAGKFEQAQHSTLLLDEISEMSLALQAKCCAYYKNNKSNVSAPSTYRIGCTGGRDLKSRFKRAVAEGRFREDLYYRLNVFPLHIPPLRERRGDIAPLAEALLSRAA